MLNESKKTPGDKNQEVELRGFLPAGQYRTLIDQMALEGHLVGEVVQETVYYQDVPLQLRRERNTLTQKTKVTLTVKSGSLGDESRSEVEVGLAKPKDFERAISLLNMLGHVQAIGAQHRQRTTYRYKDFRDISVMIDQYQYQSESDVAEHGSYAVYGFELEKMATEGESEAARSQLWELARLLNLRIADDLVFLAFVDIIQKLDRKLLSIDALVQANQPELQQLLAWAGMRTNPEILKALEEVVKDLSESNSIKMALCG